MQRCAYWVCQRRRDFPGTLVRLQWVRQGRVQVPYHSRRWRSVVVRRRRLAELTCVSDAYDQGCSDNITSTVHQYTPCHRPGAQSTLGGTTFLPEKNNKIPEFYMILVRKKHPNTRIVWYLPEKLAKFPNFTLFCPKNARILHNNCQKNIFPRF